MDINWKKIIIIEPGSVDQGSYYWGIIPEMENCSDPYNHNKLNVTW